MPKSPSPSPRSASTVSPVLSLLTALTAASIAALLAACSSDTGPSTLTDAEAQQVGSTMVSQIGSIAASFTANGLTGPQCAGR